MIKTCFAIALLAPIMFVSARAQETVFNVPSGDVLVLAIASAQRAAGQFAFE